MSRKSEMDGGWGRASASYLRVPWWLALGLLLLNDHVLKGAGLVPGWLTGKLSDVAGLVVAPVLLAAIVRARSNWALRACIAAVAVPFAAIKLSAAAAHCVEGLASVVGLEWRLWADPTDLAAFFVLPFTARLLREGAHESERAVRREGSALRGSRTSVLGIVFASVACLATSTAPPMRIRTSAFLLNLTHDKQIVQVFRPASPLDCATVAPDPHALSAADFAFEGCRTLEPFDGTPMDLDWENLDEGDAGAPSGPPRACDAVLLRSPHLADTVVFWNDVPKVEIDFRHPEVNAHAITLEEFGDRLVVGSPEVGQAWSLTPGPPVAKCPSSP